MPHEHAPEVQHWTRYLGTWVALLCLTLLSFGLSYVHTGDWELPIALIIAVAKSVLVALLFMHLIEEKFASAFVLIVSVSLIALLLSLVLADVVTRHTFPETPLHEIPPPTPNPNPPAPGGTAAPVPDPLPSDG